MSETKTKSCLLITYGPVPTPQYQTVEGGGMRVWGLAKGLKANGVDVVVAVNNSFPQEIQEHEGVRLINWSLDNQFAQLINTYDTVLMSYCMGDPSVFVVDNINDNVQLILDAYVPIYVEVSARESKDIDTEYTAYMGDITRFNKVLKRGDLFLCANEAQKVFYVGVLSSLGILNPRSYREDRILIVPFGIHELAANATSNPYQNLGITDKDFTVLWFGGLYPWFHVEELLEAIKTLSQNQTIKFVFVGGKNPFNPNPDFFKQYDKAVAFANEHKLTNKSMFFVDWVNFDHRINWYKHADVVISLNKPGEENKYSWRTRVMDYVWGELAILTNGGDPLSDELIEKQAAIRLPELTAKAIVSTVDDLFKHQAKLADIRKAIIKIKPKYEWHYITNKLATDIGSGTTPYHAEMEYRRSLGFNEPLITPPSSQPLKTSKLTKIIDITPRIVSKVRSKGVMRSARLAAGIAKTQINKRKSPPHKRRYIFIGHPFDNTGAPLVLLQVIEEYAKKYGGQNVLVLAPEITAHQLRFLSELGVRYEKAVAGVGFHFIRLQLGLGKNDFVLMNTVAVLDNYRDFIFLWLKNGRLGHAYWFIHEDLAQIPIIHREFLDKPNLRNVNKLIKENKLTIMTPSRRTKQEYDDLLDTAKVQAVNLHVEVDEKYQKPRPVSDYEELNFLISGTPSDGRKGQLLALSAFYDFYQKYYQKDKSAYRNFKLHLVSIGQDYISQQIHWVGDSLLKNHIVYYPSIPKDEAMMVTAKCNAVICCSLNETFGLYIAEGMFMGHVVLRNNSSGMEEQLIDGENGYFIDHTNINQFASIIEKLLNKKASSNQDLQHMGQASQKIIAPFGSSKYLLQIESIK
ncbi:MAG TPA: glycosyltransferase [Candidatus Saccharimonadales bacterium]|nr:glycosyltransferase [Candidatus Saccharimonadales bacterium]